uniref:Ribonuclease H-like domain-containing protein n=1 Tax=Tanacetum cinerariifolium TaxID=118510 RepID=A0A6L2JQW2_TANCI|nr:ribonuclease H-like domain-containing protein [Tanacetum cinerariifolium]
MLQKRLVVALPKYAMEAWTLIIDIVKDNKRSRTSALKAELRFTKLDVVHYALEGLPDKYNQVCGHMHYRDTFPDLKTAHSLLIPEEMRLKSKELASPVDSSSLMVLMAQSGTNRRPLNSQVKSRLPCFDFAKGSCRFGSDFRYVHDPHAKLLSNSKQSSTNTTDALLVKLLDRLRYILAYPDPPLIRVKLRCCLSFYYRDSYDLTTGAWNMDTGDLYPITAPSLIPHTFLVSQHTWHQRLGHPGSDVLRCLVSNNVISCNKKKPPVICHACQLGKHVRLPFVSSITIVNSCFDIIHSDV